MARALPFHVRQLFTLLQRLGWPQKRCAAALGLSQQAVNNWATGGMNVPARYRSALASLATLVMHQALDAVKDDPAALAQRTQEVDHYISAWFHENLDARGHADRWHEELGRKLALFFKAPHSKQGVEAWKAELALYLHAANQLRYLIQRYELGADTLEPNFRPQAETPPGWFWHLAEQLNGAPLEESAELHEYETREHEAWIASLPAERRAKMEAIRHAGDQRRAQTQQRPSRS